MIADARRSRRRRTPAGAARAETGENAGLPSRVDRLPRRSAAGGARSSRPGGLFPVQDRGLAAYIAELLGTLLPGLRRRHRGDAVRRHRGTPAQLGSDFAVVGLVHAFLLFGLVLDLRRGQRRALQPRGDRRRRGAAADRPARRGRLHPRPALRRRPRRAPGQGPAARRGPRRPLRRRDDQPAARRQLPGLDRRGAGHLPPGAGDLRGRVQPARPPRVGTAGDRHHAGLRGDGLRPAHGRLVQPGPLVRPGPDRRRVRRRLALHPRPAGRRAGRGRASTAS